MDLKLVENGDGGDVVKTPNDLFVIEGFQNMIYLALFGGCVEASTPPQRIATEQAFDWWANNLLAPGDPGLQFNSETERSLLKNALTSSGRIQIERAVKNDLVFMQDFATVVVSVQIVSDDIIGIAVRLIQPDNLQKQDFIFVWNATLKELLAEGSFTVVFSPLTERIFDFSFDLTFE